MFTAKSVAGLILASPLVSCGGPPASTAPESTPPATTDTTATATPGVTPVPTTLSTPTPTATRAPTPTAPAKGLYEGDGWSFVAPQGWTELEVVARDIKLVELNGPSGTADVYLGRDVDGLADQNLASYVRETREGIEDLYSTTGTVEDVVLPAGSAVRFTITEYLFGPKTHTVWSWRAVQMSGCSARQ